VPSTFAATLDDKPVEAPWSSATQSAVLTVADPLEAGTHTLAVEGSDGSGNRGSATFDFNVSLPPGQAVLRLKEATSEQVDLQLEAGPLATGQGGSSPAAYDIWRTDPGPGVAYTRVATVTPDSGSPGSGAYTDTDVLPGETYRYVAVALSEEKVEGTGSEPVTVTVPGSPATETTTVTTSGSENGVTTTMTESTEATTQTESDQGGLSIWAWVGIVVAGVAAVIVAVLSVLLARRRR
jgi:hypothetical protein